jgi:hypothetical protein
MNDREQEIEPEITEPEGDAPEIVAEAPEVETQEPDVEADARRLGWKPESDWKGDKSGWVDASTFMDHVRTVPGKVRKLEADYAERFARLERMQEAALKRQAEAHKAEVERIKAQMRQAVEVGDVAQWEKLDAQRERMTQDAPEVPDAPKPGLPAETQAWVAKNEWFASDEVMRAAAQQLAGKAAQLGMTTADQLAYVDREMPRYFPDKFKSKAKPTHSPVEGLSLAAPRRGGKTGADLPAEARAIAAKEVKEGLWKSVDEYAAVYFGGDA